VAGELLLRVDLWEEEEAPFVLFISDRYVGQAGVALMGFCWARSGCAWWAAAMLSCW
jgi:hypothetical protein